MEKFDIAGISSQGVTSAHRVQRSTPFRLCALLEVEPGQCYNGTLTSWSPECRLMWQYLDMPTDCFSIRIQRHWPLTDAAMQELSFRQCKPRYGAGMTEVSLRHPLFMPTSWDLEPAIAELANFRDGLDGRGHHFCIPFTIVCSHRHHSWQPPVTSAFRNSPYS